MTEKPAEVEAAELAELSFFAGMPEWALSHLAGSATKRRLEKGTMVMRQNDEAQSAFFLLSGAVQVLVYFEGVGDVLMGLQREPGSLLGWSAFGPPYRYTSSVRCEEESELFRLPRDAFEDLFEQDPYLGYQILKKVATAVDHRLGGAVASLLETPALMDES